MPIRNRQHLLILWIIYGVLPGVFIMVYLLRTKGHFLRPGRERLLLVWRPTSLGMTDRLMGKQKLSSLHQLEIGTHHAVLGMLVPCAILTASYSYG